MVEGSSWILCLQLRLGPKQQYHRAEARLQEPEMCGFSTEREGEKGSALAAHRRPDLFPDGSE